MKNWGEKTLKSTLAWDSFPDVSLWWYLVRTYYLRVRGCGVQSYETSLLSMKRELQDGTKTKIYQPLLIAMKNKNCYRKFFRTRLFKKKISTSSALHIFELKHLQIPIVLSKHFYKFYLEKNYTGNWSSDTDESVLLNNKNGFLVFTQY